MDDQNLDGLPPELQSNTLPRPLKDTSILNRIAMVAMLFFTLGVIPDYYLSLDKHRSLEAQGRKTRATVNWIHRSRYSRVVHYSYTVNNRVYKANEGLSRGNYSKFKESLDTDILFDPAWPGKSCLVGNQPKFEFFQASIGLLWLFSMPFGKRRRGKKRLLMAAGSPVFATVLGSKVIFGAITEVNYSFITSNGREVRSKEIYFVHPRPQVDDLIIVLYDKNKPYLNLPYSSSMKRMLIA